MYQNILQTCSRSFIYRRPLVYLQCHHINGSAYEHKNLKPMRPVKLLFSTALFGGTLMTAMVLRKRLRRDLEDIYRDCTVLPKDPNYRHKVLTYSYKNYILPEFVIKNMKEIQKFEVRDDDIFVVAFPKTGTTWLQELVYVIYNNVDLNKAATSSLEDRFPYLEFIYPGISAVSKMSSPRFIKSHLPFSLLPQDIKEKSPKIFYIIRNPKDVAVSYYHFVSMLTMTDYIGQFKDFFESFIEDKVPYGPLWRHYMEFWEHRDDNNIFIISYEDLQRDMKGCIEKIATFLGKSLSEDEINRIKDHCCFINMSQNPSVNYEHWENLGIRKKNSEKFMRKGKVGDWQNYFTSDMNERMEKWIDEHFKKDGLQFCYTLNDNLQ
ncbi:estrogen sulfotransferase-like [Centruroides sculpturatus]|uniref:estrogen sulfotransferase-like n=1 Tax=Centruroides sculpturatus TaxID=218467 RepID=UPI000C6CE397|nr:estrogen sulfotransferase-like [Centruroides sculpturatus]